MWKTVLFGSRFLLAISHRRTGTRGQLPSPEYWLQNRAIFETIHGTTESFPAHHGTPSLVASGGQGLFSALRNSLFQGSGQKEFAR
jgi:hypothetical protein